MRPALETLRGKKDLTGAEIGVDSGLNALEILENLDIKKLFLIDPWKHYGGMTGHGALPNNDNIIKGCLNNARKVLADYEDKLIWLVDLSENVVDEVDDNLDFVYIDGNHRYEYILKDIVLYYPKIRVGGMIAGHDHKGGEPGVVRAVREFFNDNNQKNGWDWWYIKDE